MAERLDDEDAARERLAHWLAAHEDATARLNRAEGELVSLEIAERQWREQPHPAGLTLEYLLAERPGYEAMRAGAEADLARLKKERASW